MVVLNLTTFLKLKKYLEGIGIMGATMGMICPSKKDALNSRGLSKKL